MASSNSMNSLLKEPQIKPDKLYHYKEITEANNKSILDIYMHAENASTTDISLSEVDTQRSLTEMMVLGSVLGILDLVTILGNLLVCFTIMSNKRLQSSTNYFIFSLSLSDLLLGLIVLPFSTLNTLTGQWPLGAVFCNVYISSDVMLCTISILQLFAISLDRYVAVTMPFRYLAMLTRKRTFIICASIWIFSFIMGFIPIHLGWNTESGEVQNLSKPELCIFEGNKLFVLLVAISTYFCPLIVMCAVYIKVFLIAKQQVKRINELTKYGTTMTTNGGHSKEASASDTKATFTLASVVTAFTICWLPYFVLFTAKPFLKSEVDPHVDLFFLWLGYVNSLLNPFLYAFHNTEFRYGFMLVLCRKRAERFRADHPDVVHL